MERVWSSRLRWRLRAAWLAPLLVVLVVLDGLLLTELPISGEGPQLVGGLLLAGFLNLLAVAALAPFGGMVLRTARPDLPAFLARDLVATVLVLLLSTGLLVAGLLHRGEIERNRAAMGDALALGQAWIGTNAQAEFRRHVALADVVAIVDGSVYRVCVPRLNDPDRASCAVVDLGAAPPGNVRAGGAEPNAHFMAGRR